MLITRLGAELCNAYAYLGEGQLSGLMRVTLRGCFVLALGLLWVSASNAGSAASDWSPINASDLQMTSLPRAPGAPAVILYRQIDRNDYQGYEDVLVRIKILTEDGRKYGQVEIPFNKDYYAVRDIAARTIHPDGSIVSFAGTVYERRQRSESRAAFVAKTFQLPGVEPGSILEYRYRITWSSGFLATGGFANLGGWDRAFNSQWPLNAPLYTVEGKFSLVPMRTLTLRYSWPNGLPTGSAPPHLEKGRVVMEVHDVPAFVTEEDMPPAAYLMSHVDFIYSSEAKPLTNQTAFWKRFGIDNFDRFRQFVDARGAMEQALSQIVQPGDSPDQKLRKIYARVQRLRNLEYLPPQETKSPGTQDVADVWQRGAGDDEADIDWLFLALARTAGFSADPVLVAARNNYRFEARFLNAARLDGTVVAVMVNGRTQYFNPGVPYTPYGMLPWYQTDATGLRLNEEGGSWITTPPPDASMSRIDRTATLTLSGASLDGKLTVSYAGIEAAQRRLDERNDDEAGRRQLLEQEVAAMVPASVEVKLVNTPDWTNTDEPLVAQFELHIPYWATAVGSREFVPSGVFGAGERQLFEQASRVQPIYFGYPREYHDSVAIALPAGWHVDNVPPDRSSDLKVLTYAIAARGENQSLRMTRDLVIGFYAATAQSYPAIRSFFDKVRTGDEQPVIVAPDAAQHD